MGNALRYSWQLKLNSLAIPTYKCGIGCATGWAILDALRGHYIPVSETRALAQTARSSEIRHTDFEIAPRSRCPSEWSLILGMGSATCYTDAASVERGIND